MRIGIVGYGSVAALHADALTAMPGVEVVVWGPDPGRTRSFAAGRRVACQPAATFEELLDRSEAVIIASPTPVHEDQAEAAILAGRPALVEIPACSSSASGTRLGAIATASGVPLHGVHSSRFLAPYVEIGELLAAGRIGRVERVVYRRRVRLRPRSWDDDALRHHAAHPIDLLQHWFGDGTATRCDSVLDGDARVGVAAEGRFGPDIAVTIDIAYGSGPAGGSMRIDGTAGVLESDGFTWLAVDGVVGPQRWMAETTYAASIARGDALFLDAVRGIPGAPAWEETVRIARMTDAFEAIETRRHA